jgi:hypothetical protein
MTPPFSPEQVEQWADELESSPLNGGAPFLGSAGAIADAARQQAERVAMLRAYAEALRQPPKTCATCRFNGPVEHDPFVTCGHPDNVPVGFGPEEAKRFGCTLWEPHKSHA